MKQRCTSRLCMRDCMCEGRGSNRILNEFVIQMRRGLCPNYNIDSDVVQLNIKKNTMAPKLPSTKKFRRRTVLAPKDRRENVWAPKGLGAKSSQRLGFPPPKHRRQNVGAKMSAPKRRRLNVILPTYRYWMGSTLIILKTKNKNSGRDKLLTFYKMMRRTYKWRKKNKKPFNFFVTFHVQILYSDLQSRE